MNDIDIGGINGREQEFYNGRAYRACDNLKDKKYSLTFTECGGGSGSIGKVTEHKTSKGFPFVEKIIARPRKAEVVEIARENWIINQCVGPLDRRPGIRTRTGLREMKEIGQTAGATTVDS